MEDGICQENGQVAVRMDYINIGHRCRCQISVMWVLCFLGNKGEISENENFG